MRILFLGDIVGRSGREAVCAALPGLKNRYRPTAVVVNGENAAHGFGITVAIAEELFAAGVDCITTGNHVWDQREMTVHINRLPKLLRPINAPPGTPGNGMVTLTINDQKITIINAMGRLFMDTLDDPFAVVNNAVTKLRQQQPNAAIMVDFHAETTSEKVALAHYLDGQVALVVGTHTHVPTADQRILEKGTGFMSDAGMCGCYDSVIGMGKQNAVNRFVTKMPGERLAPADGAVSLSGLLLDINPATGLAARIAPLRMGGQLAESLPAWE